MCCLELGALTPVQARPPSPRSSLLILLCIFTPALILFCFLRVVVLFVWFFLTQKTEGWILPLLTAEQQFYTQKPFFSLDSGARNLMHCKSHPLLPFPPPPLFCILFCDIFFLYLSIFKENLCIFHLQKYYQIYAAIYTPYTYKGEDPYCSLRKWLCTVKSLPFLTPGKLIKTCYTASHD